jgi:hypothetical protein
MKLSTFFISDRISDLSRVKLVRHQDKDNDVRAVIASGDFDLYQGFQSRDIFDCDYILSFIGDTASTAIFFSAYEVKSKRAASDVIVVTEKHKYYKESSNYYYEMERLSDFDDLRDRLVIDWGKGTLAWTQNFSEKEIIEILPRGYIRDFPGYLDFCLTFEELRLIYENQVTNRTWIKNLSQVSGIYLILNTKNGTQYVGSASGKEGIWGRWSTYAQDGHGGNIELERLVKNDDGYPQAFQYTILRTFPSNTDIHEIIRIEDLHKKKLGSRVHGLNLN